ncbi:MAG: hypothetical protein JO107_01995 [Hyphomicrobiales bacterium]|nr:hypothetical protein [Hyphomicrobiales bacterium]MBV8661850.1 hypothetical protein [Hyphomicrobiales bacterium]
MIDPPIHRRELRLKRQSRTTFDVQRRSELHWRPNADEWQYYIKGQARMTVFNTGPQAQTADFRAGDLGVVKKSLGRYVENSGSTDLVFLEIFKADEYQEVSLSRWLTHAPPEMGSAGRRACAKRTPSLSCPRKRASRSHGADACGDCRQGFGCWWGLTPGARPPASPPPMPVGGPPVFCMLRLPPGCISRQVRSST